jgi:hypothetical protein
MKIKGVERIKSMERSKSFPAEAGPTGAPPAPLAARVAFRGTGFSREGASMGTINLRFNA